MIDEICTLFLFFALAIWVPKLCFGAMRILFILPKAEKEDRAKNKAINSAPKAQRGFGLKKSQIPKPHSDELHQKPKKKDH
jgi:hypothetical protein